MPKQQADWKTKLAAGSGMMSILTFSSLWINTGVSAGITCGLAWVNSSNACLSSSEETQNDSWSSPKWWISAAISGAAAVYLTTGLVSLTYKFNTRHQPVLTRNTKPDEEEILLPKKNKSFTFFNKIMLSGAVIQNTVDYSMPVGWIVMNILKSKNSLTSANVLLIHFVSFTACLPATYADIRSYVQDELNSSGTHTKADIFTKISTIFEFGIAAISDGVWWAKVFSSATYFIPDSAYFIPELVNALALLETTEYGLLLGMIAGAFIAYGTAKTTLTINTNNQAEKEPLLSSSSIQGNATSSDIRPPLTRRQKFEHAGFWTSKAGVHSGTANQLLDFSKIKLPPLAEAATRFLITIIGYFLSLAEARTAEEEMRDANYYQIQRNPPKLTA